MRRPRYAAAGSRGRRTELPPGLIFEIARQAGVEVRGDREKRPILCPFHGDQHASAFLSVRNVFYCSVCTPDGGWSARSFARKLGVPWITDRDRSYARQARSVSRARRPAKREPEGPPFTAEDAEATWAAALARTRNPKRSDGPAIEYLRGRSLLEARALDAVGILAPKMPLHPNIDWWPGCGFCVIAPLFDRAGRLINVQARSITHDRLPEEARRGKKKVRFPGLSVARGTCFASATALQLLRGSAPGDRVLIGEGLTDHLGLCLTSPIPVMSAPGTGGAAACIGPWAKGRRVYLALDQDQAGDKALPAAAHRVLDAGGQPYQVRWPRGRNDACQVLERDGRDALAKFLEQLLF